MASVKKNLSFQTLYEISVVIFPLLTAPYLSRVLGAEQLGVFSYLSSIAGYFSTFAILGVSNYGSRSIAEVRDNIKERSVVFWEIFWMKAITSGIAIIIYLGYVFFLCTSNRTVAVILIIPTISQLLTINYLFFGLEKFQLTATRSLIIKIFGTALIFLLVKKPEDLPIYVAIEVGSTLIGNLYMWIKLPRVVQWEPVSISGIIRHIKPNLLLFVPLAAMSVYHMMDKTMLGIMCSKAENGFYYNADKTVNIPIGIFNGVTVVLLPKVTNLINTNRIKEYNNVFLNALYGMVVLSLYMAFGMASISKEFTPIFFGEGYDKCIPLIQYLSAVMVIKAVSFTIRSLYLIPMHKEKWYIRSTFAGAGVNLVANLSLIPSLGAVGAVLGTLMAELAACVVQIVSVRKEIAISESVRRSIPNVIIAALMFAIVRLIGQALGPSLICLAIQLTAGGMIALALTLLLWKFTSNQMLDFISVNFRRR